MLNATRCRSCGRTTAVRTRVCRSCGARDNETVELSGRGTVYAHTTIEVAPTEFRDLVPYQVVLVDMDDTRVEGRMISGSETVEIGSAVRVTQVDNGVPLFQLT